MPLMVIVLNIKVRILNKNKNRKLHQLHNLKKFGEKKIQLTMKPKLISSTYSNEDNEEPTMCSKRDSSIIMIGSNTDEIIQRLFNLLLNRFQTSVEQSMLGSNFTFDYISEIIYQCHKTSINRMDLI